MSKGKSSRLSAILVALAGLALGGYLWVRRPAEPAPAAPEAPVAAAPEPLAAPEGDNSPLPAPAQVQGSALPAPVSGVIKQDAPAARPAPPPAPAPAPRADDAKIRALIESGKLHEARRLVAEGFLSASDDAARAALAEQAIALNRKLLKDATNAADIEILTVAAGETVTHIARRSRSLHGEPGLLFLLNGIHPKTPVRAGAKLVATRGTWSIFVDKSLFKLWLCYEGAPYKAYDVCVGRIEDGECKTPAASWTLDVKNPKPTWTAPPDWLEKENLKNPIPYGHAKNPLGEYWLGLSAPGYNGFGIHGTNEPDTMGKNASMGCVRMRNPDVVELALCAWKGMAVVTAD